MQEFTAKMKEFKETRSENKRRQEGKKWRYEIVKDHIKEVPVAADENLQKEFCTESFFQGIDEALHALLHELIDHNKIE